MSEHTLKEQLDEAKNNLYDLMAANLALSRKVKRLEAELASAGRELEYHRNGNTLGDTIAHLQIVEENDGTDPRNSGVYRSPWAVERRGPK